ncbi:MAG: hypothetical protein CMJ65_17915 [Planctomycetaceae bacterium]|jgi:hypothetical protein|nr:hypothetical protein [Planctomycetaceae bacterium]MDP7274125.1 type III secretion system chaperone [Planctomycetaceae bacterium]
MRARAAWGVTGVLVVLAAWAVDWTDAADVSRTGAVTTEGLGRMLRSLGVTPRSAGTRFDFDFKSRQGEQEWDFSMSVVLSQDGQTIWLMAWLEEMPKMASRVPAAALLRLLSENDRLGNGKFFAYDRRNRRFLMQRVLSNRGISSAVLAAALKDVAGGVMNSYPAWSVAKWKPGATVRQSSVPPAPPSEIRRR